MMPNYSHSQSTGWQHVATPTQDNTHEFAFAMMHDQSQIGLGQDSPYSTGNVGFSFHQYGVSSSHFPQEQAHTNHPSAPMPSMQSMLLSHHAGHYMHPHPYHPLQTEDPSIHPVHTSPISSSDQAQCRWGHSCGRSLDDVTPAGIARHLKEHHIDPSTWHNKNRGHCFWSDWDGLCNREMNYASFGKHIASVHLHATASKCPHCQRALGRADSLDRHIKNYCEYRHKSQKPIGKTHLVRAVELNGYPESH